LAHHLFDVRETATHGLVAQQLRDLADQFAAGSVDLSYEDLDGPIAVVDPVAVVVDLKRSGHHLDLMIHLSWATAERQAAG
jgi:amphi-Trp domain-containing protein